MGKTPEQNEASENLRKRVADLETLVVDLWSFIENAESDPNKNDTFFALRERVRKT